MLEPIKLSAQTPMIPILPPWYEVLYMPTGREQKRKFERECEAVVAKLAVIEEAFLFDLFDERLSYDYSTIFQHYRRKYDAEIRKLEYGLKPKFIKLKPDYFEAEFRPIER